MAKQKQFNYLGISKERYLKSEPHLLFGDKGKQFFHTLNEVKRLIEEHGEQVAFTRALQDDKFIREQAATRAVGHVRQKH